MGESSRRKKHKKKNKNIFSEALVGFLKNLCENPDFLRFSFKETLKGVNKRWWKNKEVWVKAYAKKILLENPTINSTPFPVSSVSFPTRFNALIIKDKENDESKIY